MGHIPVRRASGRRGRSSIPAEGVDSVESSGAWQQDLWDGDHSGARRAVAVGDAAKRLDDGGIDFGSCECIVSCDVCEAYKRVHQCKLPRMIELEARNAFSGRCDGRFRELSQLTAINEGFQNVLLDVEVVIVDLRQRFLESRQIFDGFVDAVIVDVIARGLGPQDDVIANVLLDEAVAIVAGNYRIWKVHVLDLGLQLAPILLGHFATEDQLILFG